MWRGRRIEIESHWQDTSEFRGVGGGFRNQFGRMMKEGRTKSLCLYESRRT